MPVYQEALVPLAPRELMGSEVNQDQEAPSVCLDPREDRVPQEVQGYQDAAVPMDRRVNLEIQDHQGSLDQKDPEERRVRTAGMGTDRLDQRVPREILVSLVTMVCRESPDSRDPLEVQGPKETVAGGETQVNQESRASPETQDRRDTGAPKDHQDLET